MSGPEDGKYLIMLATESGPLVGTNNDSGIVKPVLVDGTARVWTVKRLGDGNYTLTIDGSFSASQDRDRNVVVRIVPSPASWRIQGEVGGPYTIEVPSSTFPTMAWTLENHVPNYPVYLEFFENPLPNQLWNLQPYDVE